MSSTESRDVWECHTRPCSRVDKMSFKRDIWKRACTKIAKLLEEETGIDHERTVKNAVAKVMAEILEEEE